MNWIEQVTWWQWVLLVLMNSFLGYWVGVGTLYCYHNLKVWAWSGYIVEDELRFYPNRTMLFAFLLWPISATYRIVEDKRFQPLTMVKDQPKDYLLYMTICGPMIKVVFMGIGGLICSAILLLRAVLTTDFLIPKFIKISDK